ncbi:MAG TPA: ATP-binding cassette domain-containing protein, partial [Cytophagaceae bacterium]|nr:ATP-binding cassette domain-containing protein [Cytophagaceae bacterium]
MEDIVIEIEHLKKSFGKNTILKDMNLKVKKGENVVVLGKSGSGKSVLIKCMVGLIEPDEGKINILNTAITDL